MIEIRYPEITDAESFYRILSEGKFEFFYGAIPESVDEERQWIARRKCKRDNNLEYNYAIIYDSVHVGGCLVRIDQEYTHTGEIGYFLDRNYFNRGIATEVVKKLEKIAFEDLGLIRLEIRMDPRNKASEKVAIKNGYKYEGLLRKAIKYQENYYDNLLYSKIKEKILQN